MSANEKRIVGDGIDEGLSASGISPSRASQTQVDGAEKTNAAANATDIEANEAPACLTESDEVSRIADPNEVDWDGPDDPQNPMNWSVARRGVIVGMAMSIVFST